MKRVFAALFAVAALDFVLMFSASAQMPLTASSPASVADRSRALNNLFAQIWEDRLKHFAGICLDHRRQALDDQLTDYSVDAYDVRVGARTRVPRQAGRDRPYGGHERSGESEPDLMVRQLIEDQEEAQFKPWEMPVNQFNGLHLRCRSWFRRLSFDDTKDYDDYIARLKKVPDGVSADHRQHDDRHRRSPRPAEIPAGEGAGAGERAAGAKAGRQSICAAAARNFLPTVPAADQTRIHDDDGRWQLRSRSIRRIHDSLSFSTGAVHSRGPDGPRRMVAARRRCLVRVSRKAEHHHRSDTGADSPDWHGRGEEGRSRHAGDREQAGLQGHRGDARSDRGQSETASHLSRDALLDVYRGDLDKMRPKLPELFGRLPKAPLTVEAVPEFMEKDQAPAYYEQGTPDGKRPELFS